MNFLKKLYDHSHHVIAIVILGAVGAGMISAQTMLGLTCAPTATEQQRVIATVQQITRLEDAYIPDRVSAAGLLNVAECMSRDTANAVKQYSEGNITNEEVIKALTGDDYIYSIIKGSDAPVRKQTPKSPNKSASGATTVISEIQFTRSGVSPSDTWFELYNSDSAGLDLSGWTVKITDLSNGSIGSAVLPTGSSAVSGGYAVLCTHKPTFVTYYSGIYNGTIDCIETTVPLPNQGRISLYDTTNVLRDSVCYNSGNACSGWSSAFPGGIPGTNPIALRDPGVSILVSNPPMDNNNAHNWRPELITGGTPGYRFIRGDVNLSGTIDNGDIDVARNHILNIINIMTGGPGTAPAGEYFNFPAWTVKNVSAGTLNYTDVPLLNFVAYYNGGFAAPNNPLLTTYDLVQISRYILGLIAGPSSDHAFDGETTEPVENGYAPAGAWDMVDAPTLPPFTTEPLAGEQRSEAVVVNGVHYTAYNSANGIKVLKLENGAWIELPSPGFASTRNFDMTYNAENNLIIVNLTNVQSAAQTIEAKKFDGIAWQPMGANNGIITTDAHHELKMTRDDTGTPYIATARYVGCSTTGYNISVWKYSGTGWISVGTPCINVNANRIDLSVSDTVYVGYEEFGNTNKFYFKKLSGGQWVNAAGVAQYQSIGIADPFDIESDDGVMYMALINQQKKLVVQKWNGTAWVSVGNIGADIVFTPNGNQWSYSRPRLLITDDMIIVAAIYTHSGGSIGFAARYMPDCQTPWHLMPGNAQQGGFSNTVSHLELSLTDNLPTVHYRNTVTSLPEAQQFIAN